MIPNKGERWKDPLPLRIRRIYEERFDKKALTERTKSLGNPAKAADKDPALAQAKRRGANRSELAMLREILKKDAEAFAHPPTPLMIRRLYDHISSIGKEEIVCTTENSDT